MNQSTSGTPSMHGPSTGAIWNNSWFLRLYERTSPLVEHLPRYMYAIQNNSLFLGLYESVNKCTSPLVKHLPRMDNPYMKSKTAEGHNPVQPAAGCQGQAATATRERRAREQLGCTPASDHCWSPALICKDVKFCFPSDGNAKNKNPKYGRHRFSLSMQIKAAIFFVIIEKKKKKIYLEQLLIFKALSVCPQMHQSTSQTHPMHGHSTGAIWNNSSFLRLYKSVNECTSPIVEHLPHMDNLYIQSRTAGGHDPAQPAAGCQGQAATATRERQAREQPACTPATDHW